MRASDTRTMSRTPCWTSFFGTGSIPHSGMPGPPSGPPFLSTSNAGSVHVEIVAVDARGHVVVVLEYHGAAGVLEQLGARGADLDHGAVRCQVATQHDNT